MKVCLFDTYNQNYTKRQIKKGETLKRGIGSFLVRGEALKIHDHPDAVPIGLMHNAVFTKNVQKGNKVKFQDVKLPYTLALKFWKQTLKRINALPSSDTGVVKLHEPIKKLKMPSKRSWSLSFPRFSNSRLKTFLWQK